MNNNNTWHENQERNDKNLFKPKWDRDTVLSIIYQLNATTDFTDIQFKLVKSYGIKASTAATWIEMSRRIMVDMNNGLNIDEALERDKERRNQLKRKTNRKYTRLSDEQVIEIRKKSADGATESELSKEYGASVSHISRIINKKRRGDI